MSRHAKGLLMSRKKADGRRFDPEKYQLDFCHEYRGLGETFNKESSKEVCQVCGGFGLIEEQESGFEGEVGT
jgi:hypothetical protein